jgi:hypothetical protein
MERDTTKLEAWTGDSPNPWSDDDVKVQNRSLFGKNKIQISQPYWNKDLIKSLGKPSAYLHSIVFQGNITIPQNPLVHYSKPY